MLDPNIKIEKKEKEQYPPLPEKFYQAQLSDITASQEETYNSKKGKTEEKEYETVFSFQFVLLNGRDAEGNPLRGRSIWHNFVPSVLYIGKNGKNALWEIVESMLQRELTPKEEAEGISGAFLNDLIGKQVSMGTKNKTSGDRVFSFPSSYYSIENELEYLSDEEIEKSKVKKETKSTLKDGQPF